MKALQMKQYGGRDVLELNQNAPTPIAGKGQVLVEVHAASINPIDWKIRAGYLKEHLLLTMPATFGSDVSGVVTATGDRLWISRSAAGYTAWRFLHPEVQARLPSL